MSSREEAPLGDEIPHTNLGNEVNERIVQSEIEGGVYLRNLKPGTKLQIRTQSRTYILEIRENGTYISGHPEICPEPVKVTINGSTWGASMIKIGFIGRGQNLEFVHPNTEKYKGPIKTSKIDAITEIT